MVKQKTARSAGREEELWQLLKSYLAGERDGAALKRELLRQLPAEQTATRPPKHGPAAPSETPPRLKEPELQPPPDGIDFNRLVRHLIDNTADGETAEKLRDFLRKYGE